MRRRTARARRRPPFDGINGGFSNFGEPAALVAGFTPCGSTGKDVFFSYLASATGQHGGADLLPDAGAVPALNVRDSVIAVYANCCGGTPLGCNDDGCAGTAGSGSKLSTTLFPSVRHHLHHPGRGRGNGDAAAAEG